MPTLAGINGASLNANLGNAVGQGVAIKGALQNQDLLRQQFTAQQQLSAQAQQRLAQKNAIIGQLGTTNDAQARQLLTTHFPEDAKKIAEAEKASFDAQDQAEKNRILSVTKAALELKGKPVDVQVNILKARKQQLLAQGITDTSDTDEHLKLLQEGNIDQANAEVDSAIGLGERLGLIQQAPEQFVDVKDANGNIVAQKSTRTGKTISQPNAVKTDAQMAQELAKARAGATSVTVKNGQAVADNFEKKEIAKVNAKQFGKIISERDNAMEMLQNVEQMQNIDIKTGALEPAKVAIASIFEGMGVDASAIADVTNAQAFQAVSNRMVNSVLNLAKGPQTEGDAQRARSTIASLGNTPEAAKFISSTLKAVALRKIEQADFVESYMNHNNSTFREARKEWNKFKRSTPSLSSIIKNPDTGLPVYFYQFKENAKGKRPDISDAEIIELWRQVNRKK